MANSQELNFIRLRNFATTLAEGKNCLPQAVLFPIGLILKKDLSNADYFCTPLNSITFASTGGDGVHFGFLSQEDSSSAPVVMTVPCAVGDGMKCNVVLGGSLFEFLCLGVQHGFLALEEFAYDRDHAVEIYRQRIYSKDEYEAPERELLTALKQEFGLQPWVDIDGRLRELERQYLHTLELPDFDEWCKRNGVS